MRAVWIYVFRIVATTLLAAEIFVLTMRHEAMPSLGELMILAVPVLCWSLLLLLPFEIMARRRQLGWWVCTAPALSACGALLFGLVVPGLRFGQIAPALLVLAAFSGSLWYATSRLNGSQPRPDQRRRSRAGRVDSNLKAE